MIHRLEHVAARESEFGASILSIRLPSARKSGMAILNDFQNHGWCHSTVPSMLQQARYFFCSGWVKAGMFLTPASLNASSTLTTTPKRASRSACMAMGRLRGLGSRSVLSASRRGLSSVTGFSSSVIFFGALDAQDQGLVVFGWSLLGGLGLGKIDLKLRLVLSGRWS